ncbi:hypothetical protein SAMN06265348_104104 [Pedobacter westerhofensis]|uniref:Uncharacterized protein n=1 Tax=Pedobacter westerhofensis TaxID=425512 RepID=A0A521CQ37_9SPHI|nr:hypothetical protein [Pedobacter westerhofensis]SMO61485.1 hypothetical protein SAMN06265348_104104 [Pedobacter westerhofensis]
MKLKLIQSGGFAGRSKSAEEELSSYPKQVQEYLDGQIAAFQSKAALAPQSADPDSFRYFIEYKGSRIPCDDQIGQLPELAEIIIQLKAKLHY